MLREMDLTAALRTGFGSVTLSNAGRKLDLEDNRTGDESPPALFFKRRRFAAASKNKAKNPNFEVSSPPGAE